jgi:HK97 gp10 family phage protein
MHASIDVDGLEQVLRDFRRLEDKEVPKAIRAANLEAANLVVPTAREKAPKRTGRLARSIGARATQKSASIKAGSAARVPYAGPIHFGWVRRHIKPQPFLYDALDQRMGEVHRVYVMRMDQAIERFNRG